MKHLPKLTILIIVVTLLLFTCQTDDVNDDTTTLTQQHTKQEYIIKPIAQSNFKTNTLLQQKLQQVKTKKSTAYKKGGFKDYNFTINTEHGKYLEYTNNNYHSYTFLVERKQANQYLENILFSLQPNGQYTAILIQYKLSKSQLITLNYNPEVLLNPDNVSYQYLDKDLDLNAQTRVPDDTLEGETDLAPTMCMVVSYSYCILGVCSESEMATCSTPQNVTYVSCSGSGGGTGTDLFNNGDHINTDPYEGGGSSTSSSSSSNLIPNTTAVVNVLPEREIFNEIRNCLNLTPQQTIWLADTTENILQNQHIFSLYDYINNNNCSDEAQDIAQQAIEAITDKTNDIETFEDFLTNNIKNCTGANTANNNFNINQLLAVYNYINQNNCNPETKAFAKAVIEAGPDAEVDYTNEIIIDETLNNTRAKCVLKELISSNNNIFKKVSEAFTDNNSQYKLKFELGYLNGGTSATASLPDSLGIITIKIDDDYVNSNSIDLANDILHETIHAELHRIYLSNNSGPNPLPNDLYNWYVKLWEHFENYSDNIGETAAQAEHTFMAKYYINNIAKGLREFDNYSQELIYYKGFAWYGLENEGINAGYVTQQEINEFINLKTLIYNDSHQNNCDAN